MKILKHMVEMPFVAATGAAALVHSTWALGTLFAGEQPESVLHLIGWLIPALLIAFALDVGQIATAAEIRSHGLTATRGITFVVFALATYYLQWLYIVHHMPSLALSEGVRASWGATATWLRDAAVWFIPALLPLSTLLYTFSGTDEKRHKKPVGESVQVAAPTAPELPENVPIEDEKLADVLQQLEEDTQPIEVDVYTAVCEDCGWTKDYTSQSSADSGLRTHQTRHCPEYAMRVNGFNHELS